MAKGKYYSCQIMTSFSQRQGPRGCHMLKLQFVAIIEKDFSTLLI